MSLYYRRLLNLGLFFALACAFSSKAQEQWWFDVEVILFDRGIPLSEVAEQFTEVSEFLPVASDWDVITATRQPNVSWLLQGLSLCEPPPDWRLIDADTVFPLPELPDVPNEVPNELTNEAPNGFPFDDTLTPAVTPFDDITVPAKPELDVTQYWIETVAPEIVSTLEFPIFPATTCFDNAYSNHDTQSYPFTELTPVIVGGASKNETWGVHALSEADHNLSELSLRIRQERKLRRLLHVAWRQPVAFGAENAQTMRLYGGQNYAQTFNMSGKQHNALTLSDNKPEASSPAEDFAFALRQSDSLTIDTVLEHLAGSEEQAQEKSQLDAKALWQIEGGIKVYLQYVGRVPYLFIDSQMHYRQPVPLAGSQRAEMRLANIPFEQLRRVISTQLHYFDHPMFGMIVEIRRYKIP